VDSVAVQRPPKAAVIEYPVLGPVEVMHIGHPEPFTLSRYIEGVHYADNKATFLPVEVNGLLDGREPAGGPDGICREPPAPDLCAAHGRSTDRCPADGSAWEMAGKAVRGQSWAAFLHRW
jgi:hypothetical protein